MQEHIGSSFYRHFLHRIGINVLEWPSFSPNLSLIEHMWDQRGRALRNRNPTPRNMRKLQQELKQHQRA